MTEPTDNDIKLALIQKEREREQDRQERWRSRMDLLKSVLLPDDFGVACYLLVLVFGLAVMGLLFVTTIVRMLHG